MEYLDTLDLPELLDFVGFRNSYKDMMNSYEDIVAEAEFKYDLKREEDQLKYLEEREKENGRI
mgnify:CR=1 FL=1